jgi:hypothetical protein
MSSISAGGRRSFGGDGMRLVVRMARLDFFFSFFVINGTRESDGTSAANPQP